VFASIIEAARKYKVAFVLLPGDLYDRPLYASDKGGLSDVLNFIEALRAICPVFAIEGTPAHDARGCYGPLERAGLVLMRPGIAYSIDPMMYTIDDIKKHGAPSVLLFGIPEPTKEIYQANHPDIDAGKVNTAIETMIERIIVEQISPYRTLCPDTPMIGMFHGNVSDAADRTAETDVIMKASDIVIKTSVLEKAGLDRWALGHIHTPWESKKINAGYAGYPGIDRNPWNKTDFVPATNLGTIEGRNVIIERIPYGTPMRVKITKALDKYDPSIAYWLDTDNPADVVPSGHSWSRISYRDKTEVSRRVSSDVIEAATTLPELAKLFDPSLAESVELKLAEVVAKVERPVLAHRDISVSKVEITGSILWGGKTASINIDALQPGLTQLAGGNGSGKSSLAGWCSPYPCLVGKDTESGRISAIKDFFDQSESGIKKTIICNGETHEHLITIRGAHTKTPKTECYLTIDGKPALEKSTFDEMMAECERRYGSITDFVSTSFYCQPLQGKAESGLMTASMTTVRDLVLNIAGIDYTREKEYALAKVRELEKLINDEQISIDALAGEIPKKDEIGDKIENARCVLVAQESGKSKNEQTVKLAEAEYNAKKLAFDAAESNRRRATALDAKIATTKTEIAQYVTRISTLRQLIDDSGLYQAIIDNDAKAKTAYDFARVEWLEVEKRNNAAKAARETKRQRIAEIDQEIKRIENDTNNSYRQAVNAWQAEKSRADDIAAKNANIDREIEIIRKPCVQCGYIDPSVLVRIEKLEASRQAVPVVAERPVETTLDIPLGLVCEGLKLNSELEAPLVAEVFTLPSRGLDDAKLAEYRAKIDEASRAESTIASIESDSIPQREKTIAEAEAERAGIVLITIDIGGELAALASAKNALEADIQNIAHIRAEIASLEASLLDIDFRTKALDERRAVLDTQTMHLEDWRRIDGILSPSKLPAMELEVFLDTIDHEATECIKGYRNGRYLFKSVTQKEGKKDTVDKYDIQVHDCETGKSKSFLAYSVGEKSFLNDAYVKALVKVRRSRTKTSYSPIVLDESDSFIEIPSIPDYYATQRAYFAGQDAKVFVVSHSPDAQNYIQNQVAIETLLK
jgi:hypothetical protein